MKKVFFLIAMCFSMSILFSASALAAGSNEQESFNGFEMSVDLIQKVDLKVEAVTVVSFETKVASFETASELKAFKNQESSFEEVFKIKEQDSLSRLYLNKRSPILRELSFRTVRNKPRLT